MALSYETDAEARSLAEAIFRKLDADASFYLEQEEVLDFAKRLFGDDAFTSIEAADTNGDGVLDMEEWHGFCEGIYEIFGKRHFMQMPIDAGIDLSATAEREEEEEEMAMVRTRSSPSHNKTKKGSLPHKSADLKIQRAKTDPAEMKMQRTKSAPLESSSSQQVLAAAAKIQALQRGRLARKASASGGEHSPVSVSPKSKHKGTTVTDIWEHLCWEGGSMRTTVPMSDVVCLFADCLLAGLGTALAECVPMLHLESGPTPEDLTAEEIAHLCKGLLQNADLSEEAARKSLESHRPFPHQERREFARMDGLFHLKQFKNLVSLVSTLMRIDEEYVVLAMQFVICGVFEMTDTMAALIIERGTITHSSKSSSRSIQTFDSELPNQSVLKKAFKIDMFQRLLYNTGCVDDTGKAGVKYGDISMLFDRALRNMTHRLEDRKTKKMKKAAASGAPVSPTKASHAHASHAHGAGKKTDSHHAPIKEVVGRAKFEMLLEELHDILVIQKKFRTCLHMAIEFSRMARERAIIA